MTLIYWWLSIILNFIWPNLSGIESASVEDSSGIDAAFAEDLSGIKTVSGGYGPGEIESIVESGSRAGMFWLSFTSLKWLFSVVFLK